LLWNPYAAGLFKLSGLLRTWFYPMVKTPGLPQSAPIKAMLKVVQANEYCLHQKARLPVGEVTQKRCEKQKV